MLHQFTFCFGKNVFGHPQQSHHDKDYNTHLDTCQKLKSRKKERIYDEHINSFSSTEKIGNINGLLGFQPALMFSPKLIFSEFLCNILESHSST